MILVWVVFVMAMWESVGLSSSPIGESIKPGFLCVKVYSKPDMVRRPQAPLELPKMDRIWEGVFVLPRGSSIVAGLLWSGDASM